MHLGRQAFAFGPIIIAGLAAGSGRSAWAAPNAQAGAAISAPCSGCHGSNGISADTSTPNLAGQHYQYLLGTLEAYKNGTRAGGIMNEIMRSLSQEQMEDLAAYYASIPISVGTPKAAP